MDTSGMLSQEEIDALLNGASDAAAPSPASGASENELLDDMEKDAVGEIGNISMGSAATALSLLLNKKVQITTPRVSITSMSELRSEYPVPCVIIDVKYTQGLKGNNLLMIKLQDAAIIADLMMGGSGENPAEELNELHLSAVSEAMNQMMGSTATSLSSMFNKKIDISPPDVRTINLGDMQEVIAALEENTPIVQVSFTMEIGDLINSKIMQLIPIDFAQEMSSHLFGAIGTAEPVEEPSAPVLPVAPEAHQISPPASAMQQAAAAYAAPSMAESQNSGKSHLVQSTSPVSVQPVQFGQLNATPSLDMPANIGLLMDVPLRVTVELGRTKMAIKDILELGSGSIVELDKLAGEPVDLLVNGKLIAKGEVVVIDENFGLRITDILSPAERVNKL